MSRPTIITISGKPGSGKSSTADKVAELLGYARYSSGDFVRSMLQQYQITLAEFNSRADHDHTLDYKIDSELRDKRNANELVIDARLGFYWIPESFKVYLDLDVDVAAGRILKDAIRNTARRSEVASGSSMLDVRKQVLSRLNSETRRFHNLYDVNPYDPAHFDLVINTAHQTPEKVAKTVAEYYKQWQATAEWKPIYQDNGRP